MDRVCYFWKTLLMNKYLLPLLLLVIADHASGQLIYGSGKTFACAGTGTIIQTESGYSTGFFWQVSTNNGTSFSNITNYNAICATDGVDQ